jgi:hypothetical protein
LAGKRARVAGWHPRVGTRIRATYLRRALRRPAVPVHLDDRRAVRILGQALLMSFDKNGLASLPGQLRNVFEAIQDDLDNATRLQRCM